MKYVCAHNGDSLFKFRFPAVTNVCIYFSLIFFRLPFFLRQRAETGPGPYTQHNVAWIEKKPVTVVGGVVGNKKRSEDTYFVWFWIWTERTNTGRLIV